MKLRAALILAAVFFAGFADLAIGEPQKQDSGSGASVQVGDHVLSIARAAAATCSGTVYNTVCATWQAANEYCLNLGGGGLFCSGTCTNNKPCCTRCPGK
ncbi:hypothetical protein AAVH_42058 [Aphelenchoides avenae]|nr:hypothetical protein AAVH_42058 [Aphelenchus avenae]